MKKPLVGRSRRPNRNATQRREQANRATARFVNRVCAAYGVDDPQRRHCGRRVGGAGSEARIETERTVEFQRELLWQERLEAELDRQRADREAAHGSGTNRGGTVGARAEMLGA